MNEAVVERVLDEISGLGRISDRTWTELLDRAEDTLCPADAVLKQLAAMLHASDTHLDWDTHPPRVDTFDPPLTTGGAVLGRAA